MSRPTRGASRTRSAVALVDNSSANAQLTAMIAKLRALPRALTTEAAPAVAEVLDTEIRAQIARGQDPDGQPWQPTQTGAQPLRNAGKALTVKAIGNVVLARITGPEALHHMGRVAGGVVRQILPSARLPQSMTRAIKRVLAERFSEVVNGR